MIDHIGMPVTDFARSRAWYLAALAPLDYELLMEFPNVAGFGVKPKPDFWISTGPAVVPIHVAFRTHSRKIVDAFYEAAIKAGGRDNGPPGPRHIYHPNYYGAFVLDPDGYNIEAVCHEAYLT